MSKLIIGLTGGIGSGKTAASDYFQKLGITIVDADVVAREVVEPGTPALSEIASHFGKGILTEKGELDRKQLRTIIFDQPDQKNWLETLLHPLIREEMIRQLNEARSPYVILVSPLLFETNQHLLTTRNLLIDVPEEIQLERACARDQDNRQQIKSIMAAQMSRTCKIEKTDDMICNDKDLEHLYSEIDKLHATYLELANEQ